MLSSDGRSQWTRDQRRGAAVARLLGLWVRILPRHWCLSLVIVMLSLEVSATDWSPLQRVLPSVVCLSVAKRRQWGGLDPQGVCRYMKSMMWNIDHETPYYAILSSFLLLSPTSVHQISKCDIWSHTWKEMCPDCFRTNSISKKNWVDILTKYLKICIRRYKVPGWSCYEGWHWERKRHIRSKLLLGKF